MTKKNGRLRPTACLSLGALFVVSATGISGCRESNRAVLTVSVAASLAGTIQEIEAGYQAQHAAVELRNNFGPSGTLAQEIEQGAPVDVFLSAAEGPMNQLEGKGLIVPGSRHDVLRNALVLVTPADSQIRDFADLVAPGVIHIALGDPASVPAGQYGKQTLEALHLFDRVRDKLVLGKDVRQVLTYVETGNADAGIVYATDAASSTRVRVAATASESSHSPIVYPVAAIRAGHHAAAAGDFIEYLRSPAAVAVFARHGFTIAPQ